MSSVTCQISMSLDGFVAGPRQSPENPLGEGGGRLHEWALGTDAWRAQHGYDGGERTIVPVILGGGERLLDDVGDPVLEPVKVVASPAITHVKYRVVRQARG